MCLAGNQLTCTKQKKHYSNWLFCLKLRQYFLTNELLQRWQLFSTQQSLSLALGAWAFSMGTSNKLEQISEGTWERHPSLNSTSFSSFYHQPRDYFNDHHGFRVRHSLSRIRCRRRIRKEPSRQLPRAGDRFRNFSYRLRGAFLKRTYSYHLWTYQLCRSSARGNHNRMERR